MCFFYHESSKHLCKLSGDLHIVTLFVKIIHICIIMFSFSQKLSDLRFVHSFPDLGIQRSFWFEKNQFYVIVVNSALEKGEQYKVKMKFRAWLTDDLAGLYKSTYKRKDGTEV